LYLAWLSLAFLRLLEPRKNRPPKAIIDPTTPVTVTASGGEAIRVRQGPGVGCQEAIAYYRKAKALARFLHELADATG
jgi:hypothetical protein